MSQAESTSPQRRLKVVALANKRWGLAPGQRFRFEQWAPHLARDHGIDIDLLPFESDALTQALYLPGHRVRKATWVMFDFFRRSQVVARARHYDAVLLFREASLIGPAFYERLIAWTGKPIIFDFDDSIWSANQARVNGLFSRLHFFGKTKTLCRIAAAVTPGNEFLAAYARQYNDNVTVMPTSIDLDAYRVITEPADNSPFVICWTGSTSTLADFEHARPALETLAGRLPIRVKIVCNRPPDRPIRGAEMQFVPWTAENELEDVGRCHVGIMPLPDDEVRRGKCGLKALQYMATGRPVVASAVGVNTEIVKSGRNGFLARTDSEFVDALMQLAQSPELRSKLGREARRTVENGYSAEIVARRFAAVVRSVARAASPA